MKLNQIRKIILIVYAISIFFLCFIWVPFRAINIISGQTVDLLGYAPLWAPPESIRQYVAIDITRLSIEIIGATLIMGVIFIIVGNKKAD